MDTKYVPFYGLTLTVGTLALWWFVFPELPDLALEDGILAGAVASVVTGFFLRVI